MRHGFLLHKKKKEKGSGGEILLRISFIPDFDADTNVHHDDITSTTTTTTTTTTTATTEKKDEKKISFK